MSYDDIYSGAILLLCLFTTVASGHEPIIYPAKGQGQDRMDKDKYECYSWAEKQTGFDPMQPPAQTQVSSGKASPLRGAAGGAALGAVGAP